jgi:glucose-6-phosphate isomerase
MDLINLEINIEQDASLDVVSCISSANEGAGKGDEQWRSLWREPMQTEHLKAVRACADSLAPSCTTLLVIGIGGSALGTKAIHESLSLNNGPCLFVLDTIDPHTVQRTIDAITVTDPNFEHTVVAVISKSGETAEIMALLMVIQRAMPRATFVAITGSSGTLHRIASARDWSILPIPKGVCGRFSVLSPVGLFPAAMCGIDIVGLLDGAQIMDDRCRLMTENPAAILAASLISSLNMNRSMHIMMPYCDRLTQFAHWYVQLWAESLGKNNKSGVRVGPTPIAAVGVTDQHSMLQLWRDGPADKVIGFIRLLEFQDIDLGTSAVDASMQWLCGHTLGSLLHAEQQATAKTMLDANQATWTLTLQRLDACAIGQFIALWQNTVAIAGRLLDVNPYNQPGVELGKQLVRQTLESH